jgi:hypothetical protein
LLVSEESLLAQEYEQRSAQPVDPEALMADPDAMESAAHQKAMQGPTMVFATLSKHVPAAITKGVEDLRRRRLADNTLKPDDPLMKPGAGQGPEWDEAAMDVLSTEWKEMLFAAAINVQVYRIDGDSVMVALQRGWHGKETRDFLVQRPEVVEVEWDGQRYPGVGAGQSHPEQADTKQPKKQKKPSNPKQKNAPRRRKRVEL